MAKDKTITVEEIQQMAPLAQVYELNKYSRYMVAVPKSELADGYEIAHQRAL